MRANSVCFIGRAFLVAALLFSCMLWTAVPAYAAGYPRRIAISPFAVLTREDISATVSVLPRLLASRLMALAGADVLILSADGKSPEEAARAAKVPLLLQGTVSKLGKGYSIDATATDLETGKPAGAFFAAAATEDDIIPQLGALSGEIAEKLFGVQGTARAAVPSAPVAAAPVPAVSPRSSGIPAAGGPSVAVPPVPAPAPVSAAPADGWAPSSLKKIGQSDKLPDEIHGVVAGDADADGNREIVTWGRNTIYIYRVKGTDILPYTRITRGVQNHFLNVAAIDIDGDGKNDLVVTNLRGGRLESFVLLRKGAGFVETSGTCKYHLEVLRGWNGKDVVAGQREGQLEPFQGKIYIMKWDGKTLSEGEPLPIQTNILPVSAGGVYSLAPGQFGTEAQWLYVDVEEKLRLLDARGKSVYKSGVKYGSASDVFEYGVFDRQEGRFPSLLVRRPPRPIPGPKGTPLLLTTESRRGLLQSFMGAGEYARVVLLQWDGSGFTELAGSPKGDFFYTGVDLLSSSPSLRGGKVIVSVVEQAGTAFKDRVGRLVLMQME